MYTYSTPVPGLSAIRSAKFLKLLQEYEQCLGERGYNPHVIRFEIHSVAHFVVWFEQQGVELAAMNEDTVAAFARHRARCRCRGTSRSQRRTVVSCVRVFLRYLRERGKVSAAEPPSEDNVMVNEFLRWMRTHRGAVAATVRSYRLYVNNLIEFLGDDPQTYTAAGLRDFMATQYRHYGRNSIRMVLAAVRMFLRYAAVEGRCRAGLDQALPSPSKWSYQSMPQGLTTEQITQVLALCPSTPRGIRDRAILLLLTRLGLRASDVGALRISDVSFQAATITVCGKGGREIRLPLPQELGDALLEYLRVGRPRVESEYIFLRSMAPIGPFASCRPGAAIKYIAQNALKRAGIQRPRRGAHVFRHTAACQMLRADVGLEHIAAVLRHRSIETTGIYAKVDLQLLKQAAQPWPEEASC